MSRPRFPIAGLMGIVVFVGVAFAAFRVASDWWVTLLFSLAVSALLVSVLGIIFGRGQERAFWTGFASGGFGYLLLVYVPVTHPLLITTKLAQYLQEEWEAFAIIPDTVKWNGLDWSSREAVVHLLATWPVAILGGYVASYFYTRSEESNPTTQIAPSE